MGLFKHISNSVKDYFAMQKSNVNISLTDPKTFYSTFDNWLTLKQNKNQVSWIYDCVDVMGKHFSNVTFRLYEDTRDGEKEEVTDHPIVSMFKKPNEFQTWWEIKYRLASHFAYWGNGYLYKLRNGFRLPMALIQLLPSRITPVGSTEGGIEEYQYNTGRGTLHLSPKDIIHFRYPDPDNILVGKAIIANILDEAEINQFQLAYLREFYKKGGFMGTIFSTPQKMDKANFDRAYDMLKAKYGEGVANSFNFGLFDQGLEPKAPPYSMKDMEVSKLRDLSRDEICSAFQTNKFMFGQAESINRATAQEVSLQYASGVIEPLMNYFDVVLTQQLAHEFGKVFSIEHDNTSPRDQDGEMAWYQGMTNCQAITPNEIREWENLEPLPIEWMNEPIKQVKQPTAAVETETVN